MTAEPLQPSSKPALTADDVRNATFPQTRSNGLGLDESKVYAFQEQVADAIEQLTQRVTDQDQQIEDLRRKIVDPANQARVQQAVSVLIKAQETADSTVAEANAFSQRVATEARATFEEARHRAADQLAEAERAASRAADESVAAREDVQREADWWATYRDSLINQLQYFLSSLGTHLSEAQQQAQAESRSPAQEQGGFMPPSVPAPVSRLEPPPKDVG